MRWPVFGRLILGLAGVFACTYIPSLPKLPHEGGPAWREISSSNFVVDTDLDEGEALGLIQDMEEARVVMMHAVFVGHHRVIPKMRVLALQRDEFAHFQRQGVIGLFTEDAWLEPVMIVGSWSVWGPTSVTGRHELAHAVSSAYIRHQPRWFAEGLAAYLQTITYDGHKHIGTVGIATELPTAMFLMDWDDLWKWGSLKDDPSDDIRARLYGTSAAAIHYLATKRPQELGAYEHALDIGEDPKASWLRIFPDLDGPGFSRVMGDYVTKRDFHSSSFTVPRPSDDTNQRPLHEPDIIALRASLYITLSGQGKRAPKDDAELAKESLASALQQDPDNYWAYLLLYRYRHTLPRRVDVGRRAIAAQEDNWMAWVWYEDVLHAAHAAPAERRDALEHALTLAPESSLVASHVARYENETGQRLAPPYALGSDSDTTGAAPATP